ncbi:MBL fold metallo-hydrolase [Aneurinibacillus uraniidurans]|uniref:MBL fold metallo-hydrolase n=1 Tax=Aneurinibacillus uraniidurans TaxID=2966586 RepID=UPI00234B82AA|nr:MBL fold metallo-hydrolase [Aneurinibacillus sp. B1]WCN39148.1 MBL fold metallo-hydrolase [Aneurinibacillus sp. B1]
MTAITLTIFDTGYCRQLEAISLRGGEWRMVPFHALAFGISHPERGLVLFDTGYTGHFFDACRTFPLSLYSKVTPVCTHPAQSVAAQLQNQGLDPASVRTVLLSHFHADHIGGVRDFGQAEFVCMKEAYEHVRERRGFAAVRHGFLPPLLPDDFAERVRFVDEREKVLLSDKCCPFTEAYDVFGDGSVLAVELPGHAVGQYGVFLTDENGQDIFLCADAAWSSRAYRENMLPHPLASLIMSDVYAYRETLGKLHELHRRNPTLRIYPTHCADVWRLSQEGQA